ncbi:zinc ribbon domain-containing protein [Butyrivibrio sp. INlla16]|uniref:zinc ribbon domain-containing protein n=1 Tax=Butyrivibrio sp. INlla16 TaxID=1520807 RepID=UPI000884B76F|nr:zinc ribbon domain-containing protein [Butyrivibrio sp. INlla16]SDB68586.1 zinc-ribbon domain [Butyrivibrio sp. INlla16]
MFFIMGITQGRKDFDFNQLVTCTICGKYGRFNVFMTYMVLSLFFIPTIKWSKRYYVQTSCCGTVYELDPEIGKAIARGENVEIQQCHLTRVMNGNGYVSGYKKCRQCGYETAEDFEFCPKCGTRF